MKIYSWNVNGIRSVFRTTFMDWLKAADPDIVCLQEIKADVNDLTDGYKEIDGYYAYFHSAKKKGYAGTAIYTKIKPLSVETELGMGLFDDEGRGLRLNFPDFTLFDFYIPHGGRDKEDLGYKLEVYRALFDALQPLADRNTILAGDFNIAHTEQDLYFPKQNANNIMFTPEERKQIDTLVDLGYTDTFRYKHPDKKSFTWWPYMRDLRERDIGWRIDYILVGKPLVPKIEDAFTQKETLGSDHCPYGIVIDKEIKIGDGPTYSKRGLFV